MKKSQISLIFTGFILLVLMTTNPSIEDHRQAVIEEVKKNMTKESERENKWQQEGQAKGMVFIDEIGERAVSRDNYLVFSITKISSNRKKINIGFGLLGKVFVQDYKKAMVSFFSAKSDKMTSQSPTTDIDLTPRINPSTNNHPYMWFDLTPGTYRSKNCNSRTTYNWNRNESGNGMAQISLTEVNNSITVAEFSTALDNYQFIEGGLTLGNSKKLICTS